MTRHDTTRHTTPGLRRRGYTAEILNAFCKDIGVTRNENLIQVSVTRRDVM